MKILTVIFLLIFYFVKKLKFRIKYVFKIISTKNYKIEYNLSIL